MPDVYNRENKANVIDEEKKQCGLCVIVKDRGNSVTNVNAVDSNSWAVGVGPRIHTVNG